MTWLGSEPGTVTSQSQLDPLCFLHDRMKMAFFPFFFFHLGSKMLSHSPAQKRRFCCKTIQKAPPHIPAQHSGLAPLLILRGCLRESRAGLDEVDSGRKTRVSEFPSGEPKPGMCPGDHMYLLSSDSVLFLESLFIIYCVPSHVLVYGGPEREYSS